MEKRNFELDFETAKSYYQSENKALKSIALQVFPELGKKELPKTWYELKEIKGYYVQTGSFIDYAHTGTHKESKNVFATKQQAEASIALAQLSQLRDAYRNGWTPNWKNDNIKFVIRLYKDNAEPDCSYLYSHFLSFQDKETRDLFLVNFRDLIEKAGPLIS